MNLLSQKTIKEILLKHSTVTSKGLGQNFLINKGPGLGILTAELAKRAKRVICIEKDKKMVEILRENMKDFDNIKMVNDDILRTNLATHLKNKKYKLVANIPYYITAPLIRFFLENEHQPQEIILMVQKEVAQRICAKPPNMSLLAVSVQYYADAKILFYVSKNSFWPSPKVDSAVIKIVPYRSPASAEKFFKIVKAGFSQPRKQIVGNLSKMLKLSKEATNKWLLKNNINPKQRAETLSVEDWKNLSNTIRA